MGRVVVAAIFLGLVAGVAAAKPMQKVRVETDPKGATVYLNDKENGPKGTTPCDIDVPVGETSVIIELAQYEPLVELVEVKTPKKTISLSRKLVRSIGMIVVEGAGAANGAKIEVDGADTGKVAPAKIDVDGGSHLVLITSRNGKELFSGAVDVSAGAETVVTPKSSIATAETGKREPTEPPPDEPEIHNKMPPQPRERIVTGSVAMDVGFRDFNYDNLHGPGTMASPQRSHFDEGGQVLVGPQVEIWPGVLAGVPSLRGLFVTARFQYGVNPQRVTGSNTMGGTTTFWQSYEASIHQRWTIADTATIQIGAGYTRDQFEFNGESTDIDIEPDTDYSSFKVAARASLLLGGVEPYLIGELRDVIDGGNVATRFTGSSAQGYRGAAGIAAKFGSISGRVEGSLLLFQWTFHSDVVDVNQASGASDLIKQISVVVGYSY